MRRIFIFTSACMCGRQAEAVIVSLRRQGLFSFEDDRDVTPHVTRSFKAIEFVFENRRGRSTLCPVSRFFFVSIDVRGRCTIDANLIPDDARIVHRSG
jgi:hypothetical protein